MRSYEAARSTFGAMEFIARSLMGVGVIIIIGSILMATEFGSLSAFGVIPGVIFGVLGFFAQAYVQTSRASVDSAEYAQQSLQLARDQFEISKQMLRLSNGTTPAATYTADDPPIELEEVKYDTAEPVSETKPPATPEPKLDRVHQYSSTRITESQGKFLIDDKSYDTLADAKLAIDGARLRKEVDVIARK